MHHRPLWLRLAVALSCLLFVKGQLLVGQQKLEYNRDIRPLLVKNCFACHGMDENSREADLRLDRRESALESGAILPHQPDQSEMIARIQSDDPDQVMPPIDTGHKLTEAEIDRLRRWIAEGATYQEHWSFRPPRKPELPRIVDAKWVRNSIDPFVFKRLEDSGLRPGPPAERLRLLRRVALDLTGLPPTLEQADEFLADPSPQAYEKVVDRMLASADYGEHWARMWLDLARYADTKGYEKDRHRDIWRYRDWVIDALNGDMPYDQFTLEQLAGDLLADRTDDQVLATAFHRNTMTNEEGGTDDEEFRTAAVKDRVDTTIQVWMGLTMGCAKCHSHKYDPISLTDYYSFLAYFNQTRDTDTETPLHPTPTRDQAREIARQKSEIERLARLAEQRPADFEAAFQRWQEQLERRPLWQTLRLQSFRSEQQVVLTQNPEQQLIASGPRPDKDTWTLVFDLPVTTDEDRYTSLRIDYFPQELAGGDWENRNVAVRELTAELIGGDGVTQKLKLINPRASFSQRRWSIASAIDGKPNVGWGLSPRFKEQQVGLFDFERPIAGGKLKLTLEQQHGDGLLLARSRFSVSGYPTGWLQPELAPEPATVFTERVHPETRARLTAVAEARSRLQQLEQGVPRTPVMLELPPDRQRQTRVHNRGNFLDPGDPVSPAVLTVFGVLPDDAPVNRVGVAQWLMQADNPLTARVMVNRVWARIFGTGLVETEEDFGSQGMLPSHPELLDWLAVDFREQGWSLKKLIKTIVMSHTYRQSSRTLPAHLSIDPRNRLLSRGPRFRLSAEMVRDQALAASGLLTRKLGGKSVMPPQPGGIWKSTYSGEDWQNARGPDRYRRGLYTYLKRTSPYPAMTIFDAGSGEVCQIRRMRTNTPIQALVTLNDTVYLEAAGGLAARMQASADTLSAQIENGFRRLLVRRPTAEETQRLVALYHSLRAEMGDGADFLKAAGLEQGDPQLVAVASVLLNLDEALMK